MLWSLSFADLEHVAVQHIPLIFSPKTSYAATKGPLLVTSREGVNDVLKKPRGVPKQYQPNERV
jgi:hypothetical protein